MAATVDYYDLLGVDRDADPVAIKRAFRSRARELHPDVSSEPEAEARFRELAAAYRVLSSPHARLLYDRFGYLGPGNGGFAPRAPVVAELELDVLEATRGAIRRVLVTRLEPCAECGGGGAAPGSEFETCGACRGLGLLRHASHGHHAQVVSFERCSECGGSGYVGEPCLACGGDGRTEAEDEVDVTIPARPHDGDSIELPDGGGRVLLRVPPLPHDPGFVRYGAAIGLALAFVFLVLLLRVAA